jgi:predicted ester cyclase
MHYVHDQMSYNGETMTRRQYQDLIAADVTAIPDLVLDAHIIVTSGDQVACRLVFDCTPAARISRLLAERQATHLRGVSDAADGL